MRLEVRKLEIEVRGMPHLAKNERDVGHPSVCCRDRVRGGSSYSTSRFVVGTEFENGVLESAFELFVE